LNGSWYKRGFDNVDGVLGIDSNYCGVSVSIGKALYLPIQDNPKFGIILGVDMSATINWVYRGVEAKVFICTGTIDVYIILLVFYYFWVFY
jgi:hypothetical protein